MNLIINSGLVIPSKELKWRFSRASGPGGQSINTSDSRVELVLDVEACSVIGPFRKGRLITYLGSRLTAGCLHVVVAKGRSQYQNRKLALERMACLIREGLKQPHKARKPTKPSHGSQKRRMKGKKKHSELKRKRQSKPSIDD